MIFGRKHELRREKVTTKNLLIPIISGICCITIAILCATMDPLLLFVRSKLKLVDGGLIHEILNTEYKGLYLKVYGFNITNGDRFLSGEDHKLKMEEVGPFVYQEYRTNEDIEILPEEGIMRYSPKMRTKFIPEDSIGDPRNFILNLPNVALLGITGMLNPYPFFVKNLYELMVIQQNAKLIIQKDLHSFMWDYTDPLVTAINRLVPGIIYYQNIGIMDRLYDSLVDYRLELGATEEDKFQVKFVNKTIQNQMGQTVVTAYNNSYEGMGYPPDLPPEAPRLFFRQGVCKTLEMEYVGKTTLNLNTEGHVFDYHRRTFENRKLCDGRGYCPYGLLDLSDCFTGIPLALSRSHFTGGDPALFDRIEGLKPDPVLYENMFQVEPRVGLLVNGKTSLQLNMAMGNVSYNSRVYKFRGMVVPLLHARGITPPLPEIIQTKLDLFYLFSYKAMMAIELVLVLTGLLLLGRATQIIYSKSKSTSRAQQIVQTNPANTRQKDSEKQLIDRS